MVVVADGANAEFGRSQSAASSTSSPSRARTTCTAPRTSSSRTTRSRSAPKQRRRHRGAEVRLRPVPGRLHARRADRARTRLFYFVAFDYQKADSTKQTDPRRIEQRVVDAFAALGSPNENGPIERTNDARVFLAQDRLARLSRSTSLTLRYNYTWSEQKNGTFDVDSWGRSANAIEKDYSHAVSGSLISTLASDAAQRVPLPVRAARTGRARTTARTSPARAGRCPTPRSTSARSYRFGEPFFIPVKYYDTRVQFNDNVSFLRGAHSIKVGVGVQPRELGADVPRIRQRPLHLQLDRRLPQLRAQPELRRVLERHDVADRRLPGRRQRSPGRCCSICSRPASAASRVEEAGTQSIPQTEPAVFVQDSWQATPNLNVQYGLRWEAQIEPDPITPAGPGLLRRRSSARPSATATGVPVERQDPVATRRCGSRASASPGIRTATARACSAPTPASSTAAFRAWRWRRRARPTAAAARRSSATAR